MDTDAIYEKWRQKRSQAEPAADFAGRVMQTVNQMQVPHQTLPVRRQAGRWVQIGACAAAVLAALFRVVELLTLFSAGNIEN